ncbi:glycosyltransferase 87 family protein [Tsukamurella sp. PLM1]|uniref:glycosyltransferase 87 family protein n=1 Tax=Tsukamurella sp. PLM1 TaxID=2929795 RepID=UPI0020648586|nr:glycosyltransferase 87 family protein [Tsukamurella sp. PLM1]BDH56245.1 polyprenol-phosphate-mannose-dependent alpha-(1-2)-phosphatidylinositol pentamannoside mannosyltransferase [Tsukamurella sp. PLM1]
MTRDRSTPASGSRSGLLERIALPAFVVAVGARIVWILAGKHNFNFVDLRVYYEAARRVSEGGLYDFALSDYTPQQPLPFTYPPFAGLFFYPLRFLPFPVVAVGWVALTAGLLFLVIRMCLAILAAGRGAPSRLGDVPRELPLLWTAAALWIDPVRTNLDYGQINVVLMTLGVWAAYLVARTAPGPALAPRPAKVDGASGLLIGVAAGIKLTPAVGGLFLLARGRVWAAACSAVTFGATVGISYLLLPAETRRYFTVLLGDTGPIGDPAKPDNQAMRGAMSRFVGYDVGTGAVWVVAVAIAAALLFAAWWVVRRGDALIALVLVQYLGLMASPISWIHHFVWIVPLLIWLVHGPLGRAGADGFRAPGAAYTRWATVLAGAIAVLGYIGVHIMLKTLGALGLHDGVLWAVLMAHGVFAAGGLVVLILAQRRALRAVV